MKEYELAIQGGDVVFQDGIARKVDIGVADGRIAALSSRALCAATIIDAKNLTIIPGVIDQHFHVFVGFDWETWENATKAAVRGGVTTVIKMPLDKPPTLTVDELRKSMNRANESSYVDHAFLGGFIPDDPEELDKQAEEGVVGYKLFIDHTAPPGMYPGLNAGEQLEAFVRIAKRGRTASVHSEDPFIIDRISARLQREGREDPGVWEEARPVVSELAGITRTVLLAKEAHCRTVVAHVSIPSGVDVVAKARAEGYPIFVETCPHYLLLTKEDLNNDKRLKWNPPSREKKEVEKLWEMVSCGLVHAVGSDHAPLSKDLSANIWEMAPGGGNAVETMLSTVMTEAIFERGIPIERVVSLLSTNPAKIFGLYPQKGCIAIGSDADFVLLDMNSKRKLDAQELCYLRDEEKWSPFDGWTIKVVPKKTILRGKVVMEDGEILVKSGFGKCLKAR